MLVLKKINKTNKTKVKKVPFTFLFLLKLKKKIFFFSNHKKKNNVIVKNLNNIIVKSLNYIKRLFFTFLVIFRYSLVLCIFSLIVYTIYSTDFTFIHSLKLLGEPQFWIDLYNKYILQEEVIEVKKDVSELNEDIKIDYSETEAMKKKKWREKITSKVEYDISYILDEEPIWSFSDLLKKKFKATYDLANKKFFEVTERRRFGVFKGEKTLVIERVEDVRKAIETKEYNINNSNYNLIQIYNKYIIDNDFASTKIKYYDPLDFYKAYYEHDLEVSKGFSFWKPFFLFVGIAIFTAFLFTTLPDYTEGVPVHYCHEKYRNYNRSLVRTQDLQFKGILPNSLKLWVTYDDFPKYYHQIDSEILKRVFWYEPVVFKRTDDWLFFGRDLIKLNSYPINTERSYWSREAGFYKTAKSTHMFLNSGTGRMFTNIPDRRVFPYTFDASQQWVSDYAIKVMKENIPFWSEEFECFRIPDSVDIKWLEKDTFDLWREFWHMENMYYYDIYQEDLIHSFVSNFMIQNYGKNFVTNLLWHDNPLIIGQGLARHTFHMVNTECRADVTSMVEQLKYVEGFMGLPKDYDNFKSGFLYYLNHGRGINGVDFFANIYFGWCDALHHEFLEDSWLSTTNDSVLLENFEPRPRSAKVMEEYFTNKSIMHKELFRINCYIYMIANSPVVINQAKFLTYVDLFLSK